MKAIIISTLVLFVMSIILLVVDKINQKFFGHCWKEELDFVGSMTCLLMAVGFGWILLCL